MSGNENKQSAGPDRKPWQGAGMWEWLGLGLGARNKSTHTMHNVNKLQANKW